MKNKYIGMLFIVGAIGVLLPYTTLTIIFDYPDILREDAGVILTKFHDGGSTLILVWWLFGILGIPLLIALPELGKKLEEQSKVSVRWITTLGIIGLIVQMIGLLRWTFVVPLIANNYISGDESTKAAAKVAFEVVHQYGGVVLGEHIGQLFSILWTVMMTLTFSRLNFLPKWMILLGYISSFIYVLAQTELFATVITDFIVINWAGFVGSSLWLVWLIALGIYLQQKQLPIRY